MEVAAKSTRPSPEQFQDYRDYLQFMVAYLRETNPSFSYRYFARRAGFASPSFLKLVLQGKRNLSPHSVAKFAGALGLSATERETFETLVCFAQAKTDAERNHYYGRLARRSAKSGGATDLTSAQYEAYSLWYALPIREMMLLPDFREDPGWIGRRLRPNVKAADVRRALTMLERLGLVVRDGEGRLRPAETKLKTPAQVRSLALRNYHRSMLGIAAQSLDGLPVAQRNVSSVTLTLSRSQYQAVCERIEALQRELLDMVDDTPQSSAEQAGPREVHVLGFQVVPLTKEESK